MSSPESHIKRCLELAKIGLADAIPNPSVGCVIVYEDRIIGEGFTSPYGGNHAEVNAINSVKDHSFLAKSTLYVSLEPCAHFGKTPPCANLIIEKNIKRVVIACLDPFAEVNGLGIKRLMKKGVDVKIGVLGYEARELNKRFFTFHEKKRPYIILKWAETNDGFVDGLRNDKSSNSLKITGGASNILVHKWRSEEQAIMVGRNTALLDNPSLTTRNYEGRSPIRILLDSNCSTSKTAAILNSGARTIVLNSIKDKTEGTVEYVRMENLADINSILSKLYDLNIQSVLVEGGPTLHHSFYQTGNWDEIRRFVSPDSIEFGIEAMKLKIEPNKTYTIGVDKLYTYPKQ
ncbi:MAG: diaminohydroxyphosphoribosylaminopyrimidine deaminase [Bacteroidia bacterium]|jgi:diaminohydroxyphosphoribosylaminopyrimidine deaminase/5-amino-6-(5-phosphoribosylamino)uracil reductase